MVTAIAVIPLVFGLVLLAGAGTARGSEPRIESDSPACQFASTTTTGLTTTMGLDPSSGGCTWTPPSGITSVTFTLYGAQGGTAAVDTPVDSGGTPGQGGLGSEVVGTLNGIGGTTLQLNVGGGGGTGSATAENQTGTGSFNGGGPGTTFGGDGGGATDIRGGSYGPADRILVAGGGGGGGSAQSSGGGGNGGDGDTNGSPGGLNECTPEAAAGGYSGDAPAPNQGVGGAGSPSSTDGGDCSMTYGTNGGNGTAAGDGGAGSPYTGAYGLGGGGGGGGGGGYFGGGGGGSGGASDSDYVEFSGDGGGGGGSSYTGGADGIVPTATSILDPVSPAAPGGYILVSYSVAAPTTTTTAAPATTTTIAAAVAAPTTTTTTVPPPALAVTGVDVLSTVFSGSCFVLAGIILTLASTMEIRRRRGLSIT
jgi:hypothetical protein